MFAPLSEQPEHMKKTTTIIIAAFVAAVTAQAELGETVAQFETGPPTEVNHYDGGYTLMTWRGKNVVHTGVFRV